jgi:hypothetical protein
LTEINHKVSLIAKGSERKIAGVFAAKCAEAAREAIMDETFIGNWARESHLSVQQLNSIRDLNRRFLDLAGARRDDWEGAESANGVGRQLTRLTAAQRTAAASCPYALFDLRFGDATHWKKRLECAGNLSVADGSGVDDATIEFVRLAVFYTWHVASGAGLAAHLLLGMPHDTVDAFRRVSVASLPGLAMTEAVHLNARWSDCGTYWNSLISAAAGSDPAALRRVQLSGLQLAVASRLPKA